MIYLDHSAATPMLPAVLTAMQPFWTDVCANPASAHRAGQRARQALEDAREQVAHRLGAFADEVIFTSGATEANNLAIAGVGGPGSGIAISAVEHPSVREPARRLAAMGQPLEVLPVDATGRVQAGRIREDARLISIQLVNHETGVIQPIAELAQGPVPFHCDAAQAAGKLPIHFHDLGVTALSISGHKFHGPKGIGALLLQRGAALTPGLHGGHQQQGRRPGTEPVALAVGLAAALRLAHEEMAARRAYVEKLRQRFLDIVQEAAPVLNPATGHTLPYTLNLSFPGCQADILLMKLDLAGVACSTGSACSSGSLLPSPVLQAMAVPAERLRSAMRFSFSALLPLSEVETAARRVVKVVGECRSAGGI